MSEVDNNVKDLLHDIKYITKAFSNLQDDVTTSELDLKEIDDAVTNSRKDLRAIKSDMELFSEQMEHFHITLRELIEKYDKEFTTKLNLEDIKYFISKYISSEHNVPIKIKVKKDEIVIIRLRNGERKD